MRQTTAERSKLSPTILITRPYPAGSEIARAFAQVVGREHVIHSPLMTIDPTLNLPDLTGVNTLIVTSSHAIQAIGELSPRRDIPVLCVGEKTTARARDLGFEAKCAGQTASDLVMHLVRHPPAAPCLYLRGTHVSLNLATRLIAQGIETREHIIYTQRELSLSETAKERLHRESPIILPLYSKRSAELFFQQLTGTAPLFVAAISEKVAEICPENCQTLVAQGPTAALVHEMTLKQWNNAKRLEGRAYGL